MGGIFGGGGSESIFGGRGASPFLVKVTSVLIGLFLLTSFTQVLLSSRGEVRLKPEKVEKIEKKEKVKEEAGVKKEKPTEEMIKEQEEKEEKKEKKEEGR
jgi:preprotein translocase subunit SecG